MFLKVFTMEHGIFGDAAYEIYKSHEERLRLPTQSACEADMRQLRDYTVNALATQLDCLTYTEVQDITCTRIMLFNGWCG